MAQESSVSLHTIVTGRVQGVSFRYYTQEYAEQLNLTGWVKNLRDGSVEVLAEGPRAALDKLLHWLHHGPPTAAVNHIQAEWGQASGAFARFEVRF